MPAHSGPSGQLRHSPLAGQGRTKASVGSPQRAQSAAVTSSPQTVASVDCTASLAGDAASHAGAASIDKIASTRNREHKAKFKFKFKFKSKSKSKSKSRGSTDPGPDR